MICPLVTKADRCRAARALAKKLGLCQRCPLGRRRSAIPGQAVCEECRRAVRRAARARSRRLAAQGLCDRCGLAPRTVGILCAGCDEKRRAYPSHGRNATKERRRRENVCRTCGEGSAFASVFCVDCAKLDREKKQTIVAERVAAGLCYRCGLHPAPAGRSCEPCRERRRSSKDRRRTPTPLCAVRCGACGKLGHRKSARRCPAQRGATR